MSAEKPLFVRLPTAEAEALDRAAFQGGISKRELVTRMVRRYLDSTPPEPLVAGAAPGMRVGRHAFRPAPASEVLTLEQAADLLQVEPALLEELAERGEAPGRRIGEQWRFSRAALLAWLGD